MFLGNGPRSREREMEAAECIWRERKIAATKKGPWGWWAETDPLLKDRGVHFRANSER